MAIIRHGSKGRRAGWGTDSQLLVVIDLDLLLAPRGGVRDVQLKRAQEKHESGFAQAQITSARIGR